MIHLDTNYLIGLAVRGSTPAANVDQWLAGGETLGASALAWTEFLNGPVSASEIVLVETVIAGNVVAFEKPTAALAAQLFNQTGRRRGSRFDCLIAATAIAANAEFATENQKDFLTIRRAWIEVEELKLNLWQRKFESQRRSAS